MDFLEKNLEDIIIENPSTISSRGFPLLLKNNVRQFKLPSGRKVDILSFEFDGEHAAFKIFELKRDTIDINALVQVADYASEIYALSAAYFPRSLSIERFIVGAEVDKPAQSILESQVSIEVVLYKYTIGGIFFRRYETIWETQNKEVNEILYEPTNDSFIFHQQLSQIDSQFL